MTTSNNLRPRQQSLLLVESDCAFVKSFVANLNFYGAFDIHISRTAADAFEKFRLNFYGAIIIDVALPDMTGNEACKRMRDSGVLVPILMLTLVDSDAELIQALNAGANDYVNRSMRIGVLLARLRAHLHHYEKNRSLAFAIGPLIVDPERKCVTDRRGQRIADLTSKELQILMYLHSNGAKPTPRLELLERIWGYNPAVNTHTIESHIYRLRRKIDADPEQPSLLVTEKGGYRLAPEE
ncbi:MAG: response regulator transcription factor [Proteobacteria bacterium]|nr:response regulator transcription factor [Pseudomonadota bacterium]